MMLASLGLWTPTSIAITSTTQEKQIDRAPSPNLRPSHQSSNPPVFPPRIQLTSIRQANRPPNPSRAQSLLRKRAHLPLMAEFHRHPRRLSRRAPEFRRSHRSHLRSPLHRHRHGRNDLRSSDIPLASAEYPPARAERHR